MNDIINLFMWGYQQHFQDSLQFEAEQLFNNLDSKFEPRVFLIGVLIEKNDDRHPICLEPENCGYRVESFSTLKELAKELKEVDEESRIFHSHPVAQENHLQKINIKAYKDAIGKILKKEDLYGNFEKFISFPTYIKGFLVFAVLELRKETLNSYYTLSKDKFQNRLKISRSFIESTIDIFLKECTIAFKDPDKAISAIERSSEELLRESAKQFMYSISQAGGNFEGLHGLYESCNAISSLKYEGEEGLGKLVIAPKEHINIRLTLELEEPIRVNNFRKVRKFLELSNSDSLIISDSAVIYGLGEIIGKYNPKSESLFVINFTNHYKYEILHDNNQILNVEYRLPYLPKDKIDREKFYDDFSRIFKLITKKQINELWDLTLQATEQKHGTMLVISENAIAEAKRLGKQSFALKPLKLTPKIINQITSIDGSVMMDIDSTCHAIGVILDGLATEKGDSSRGARYNSAIRYYENFATEFSMAIIIISEDGMIDIIPKLKPRIKHSEISDRINELKSLNSLEKVERKKYYPIINWFESNQFYLTDDECDKINKLRKEIEKKEAEPASIWIVRKDLVSNDEMNDSYYE